MIIFFIVLLVIFFLLFLFCAFAISSEQSIKEEHNIDLLKKNKEGD